MTEIVYYVAATLDGFIAGPRGELDWLHAFGNAGTDYGLADFMRSADAVVMGRATCDVALSCGAWPYGERPGWVLSRRPRPAGSALPAQVGWGAVRPHELLAQWRSQGVRRGWLVGGGEVAGQFLRQGCVHRLMLATMPVTLGAGIPLWGAQDGLRAHRWVQWSHRTYDNGVCTQELWRATDEDGCGESGSQASAASMSCASAAGLSVGA